MHTGVPTLIKKKIFNLIIQNIKQTINIMKTNYLNFIYDYYNSSKKKNKGRKLYRCLK